MTTTPTAGVVDGATPPQTNHQQNDSSGAADQAREKATEVADQAREKASEAAGEARGRVRDQVDERSNKLGEQVGSTASDLRTVGEELRKQGKDTPAKLADQAAERSEKIGRYLSESDADRILGDVEDFARKQPWAVVAGGIALGFVASRFLKASSSERYRARQPGTSGTSSNGTHRDLPPPQPREIQIPPAGDIQTQPAGIASGAPVPGGFAPPAA